MQQLKFKKYTKSMASKTNSVAGETTCTYDNAGRKLTETKPGSRTVTYTYFPTGELKTMTGAETYPQGYTYEFGRLKTLTTYRNYSADPEVTTWIYNNAGQLTAKKYANNSQVTYEYDSFGQLSKRAWAGGRTTDYAYDGAGRLSTVTYSGNDTPAIAYSYDRRSRLTQVVDAAGTRTITYNADNTPATETVPNVIGHTVTHTYDTLGRETALKLMNGATALYETGFTYDNMSRLATATFANQSATYSRISGSNRLNTTIFKNGTTAIHTATRSYDNFNRLLGVNGYNYTYNDKDERTKQALADGNYWEYGYDTLGQVTSGAKKTSAGAQVSGQNYGYTYDTIGNRKTSTANSALTSYTANDLNQYTAIGSVAPTYDTDGNMLTGHNGWTMEWNGENRLKTIYNATTKLEFQYDYMGRRFSKKVYTKSGSSWVLSNEKAFAYNGYKQIAEYTVSGTTKTLSKSTIWQPAASGDLDVVLWYRDSSTIYTLLPDGNKNTRQLKNTAGTVVATYDYAPFGNVIATTGTVLNPWKFSSEYHDSETGLVYYNYRDYAPSLGRWISRDPLAEHSDVSLICYLKNSQINYMDNYGLKSTSSESEEFCCYDGKQYKVRGDLYKGDAGGCCMKVGKLCLTKSGAHQNIELLGKAYSFGLENAFYIFLFAQYWNSGVVYEAAPGEIVECVDIPYSILKNYKKELDMLEGTRAPYQILKVG